MNIVLIGYRGTGKSAVGKRVSASLKMACISMDERIVEKAGMSIPGIVAKHGWPAFRDMESEVAREMAKRDNIIVDTGGGIIERPENIEVLQVNSRIIWLKASVGAIVSRIQEGADRPSLTGGKSFTEEVADVLEQRGPKYKSAAQYTIETDLLTIEQVAESVVGIWEEG